MQIVSLDKIPVLPRLSEDKLEGMNLSANEFVKEALCQMRNLCYSLDGVGLHAVQVGLPYNVFVAKVSNYGLPPSKDDLDFFALCRYEGIGEKQDSIEGCLSIKDENGCESSPDSINLKYIPSPIATITTSNQSNTICNGMILVLSSDNATR